MPFSLINGQALLLKILVFHLIIKNMEKTENFHVGDWLKDLPIPAENLAFKPEKIILCRKCERTKSPTRLD